MPLLLLVDQAFIQFTQWIPLFHVKPGLVHAVLNTVLEIRSEQVSSQYWQPISHTSGRFKAPHYCSTLEPVKQHYS